MLNHGERMGLARSIVERVAARDGSSIVAAAVFGSTARRDDVPWSDLELLLVTRASSAAQSTRFVYRGVLVSLVRVEHDDLASTLTEPSEAWVYWMGVLDGSMLLHGQRSVTDALLARGRSIPRLAFRRALEDHLSVLVEPYGRIFSSFERGDERSASLAVLDVLTEIRFVLCLLNERWLHWPDYRGFAESFRFEKVPSDYEKLVAGLWCATDRDQLVPLAQQLLENFWQLLVVEGIRLPTDHELLDDLPV